MDDTDFSTVSEDGAGDVPDGDTSTLEYSRYPDIYLYNSGADPSSDFPASYNALMTAYGDLKKRYNELQTKHRVALRQIKRSSAPPDLQSPSGTYSGRRSEITNGDVNSWSSRGSDNLTSSHLEMQLYETLEENVRLKNQVKHLSDKIDNLEKQCTLLSERTQLIPSLHSQHQSSMKQAQEKHLMLENENEDLRKQVVARDKKLKDLQLLSDELNEDQRKHIVALEEKLKNIETDMFRRDEKKIDDLGITTKSLADALSFMKLDDNNDPIETKEGDISLSTELEPLLKDMVQLQSDILQLRDMVAKQQKVIQMLSRRQANKDAPTLISRGLSQDSTVEGSNQKPVHGQGARPKIRSNSTNVPPQDTGRPLQFSSSQTDLPSPSARRVPIGHESSMVDEQEVAVTLRESGSESALSDLYTKDILRPRNARNELPSTSQYTHLKDYLNPVNPSLFGNINVSGIKDIRSGAVKRHSAFDIYPTKSTQSQSGQGPSSSDGFIHNKRHTVSGIAHELERDPFEKLSPGIQVEHDPFENLSRRIESDASTQDVFGSRDLPYLPAGFHRQHDSLEHLRDDVPHEQNLEEVLADVPSDVEFSGTTDLYQTGQDSSFNDRDLSDTEMTMTTKDNTQRLTPDGSVENRYRNTGSSGQLPRPIDIERNDCDTSGSSSRAYDNTSANVNINYQSSGKLKTDSAAPYQVLNNNPLVGHKTIPIKNIYQEPGLEVSDDIRDTQKTPPANTRMPGDGRSRFESFMSRVCPVCEEDFGYTIPMEDFQHHVLDCLAVPNPSDSPTSDERVCPMCSEVFPNSITQREFEMHVNEHFEEDNRSFVNDFEVLQRTSSA